MIRKNEESGFSLLEVMTAVAIMGVLVAMAAPSMLRMRDRQETRNSATEMAGLLADARSHAVAEGTPHLVYFNAPTVDGNGACGAAAVEVKDVDHSYSITPGDQTKEFNLPSSACANVKQYTGTSPDGSPATVPMPSEDLAVRAPDAAAVGAVATSARASNGVGDAVSALTGTVGNTVSSLGSTVGGVVGSSGSGSSGSGSGSGSGSSGDSGSGGGSANSGSGTSASIQADGTTASLAAMAPVRSATVAETVVNGSTFPVDGTSGRPVVAFSELGIPVDPANPNSWGSGAGGVYLTDSSGSSVFAALVEPMGDVKLRAYDPASQSWK
jgi:prepilin-type N-terminal cleavage/methylation domain-containing protein